MTTMRDGIYLLQDLADLKSCTIEEFVLFASSRGVKIPNKMESRLSLADVNLIDPSLAYKLRYKKPERQITTKQPSVPQEDSETKDNRRASKQTLHSLESLGSPSKEEPDAHEEDPDYQKKSLVLKELISMVNYADMMTIEDVHTIRQKWEKV